ncbi:hypothetical protein [Nonomuraea sp. NPDC003214]
MAAAAYDLLIEQGTDYECRFILTQGVDKEPIDLTGAQVRAQIRTNHSAAAPLLHDLAAAGHLTITDAAAGIATMLIPGAVSAAWEWRVGVWDLELVDAGGRPLRLLRGAVRVSPEVTR